MEKVLPQKIILHIKFNFFSAMRLPALQKCFHFIDIEVVWIQQNMSKHLGWNLTWHPEKLYLILLSKAMKIINQLKCGQNFIYSSDHTTLTYDCQFTFNIKKNMEQLHSYICSTEKHAD